ncbi:MAG: hypothetical protein CMI31_12515 [Opitutae bacterium]|nr:hypothetical protein [Opitutae bacterium]
MEVYLFKDGQRFGPYSMDQVKEYLASGDFAETDLAYFEGRDGWVPITKVPGVMPQDDDFDDPEVDLDRQRELAEMFPDPDDDFGEGEEEVVNLPTEAAASVESNFVHEESPQPQAEPQPANQEPADEPNRAASKKPSDATPSDSGGRGRRFSLSKAQAARRKRGGRNGKRRGGGIPLPRRPGIAAFGWLIFLSLIFGVGASLMPEAGVERSSSSFMRVFGNMHPLLVHLPLASLFLALPMHFLDRPGLFRHIGSGSVFVLWFGVLGSLLAVFSGYVQSYGEFGSDSSFLNDHEIWGILVGAGACGSLFLKLLSRRFGEVWLHHLCSAFLFATVIMLFYVLHTGASITHGNNYLGADSEVTPAQEKAPADEDEQESDDEEERQGDQDEPEIKEESPF